MKESTVRRWTRILGWLLTGALILNIGTLLLVPGFVSYVSEGGPAVLRRAMQLELEQWLGGGDRSELLKVFFFSWRTVWLRPESALLTCFYWLCGGCTALTLVQAKRVVGTILVQKPFQGANARSLGWAARCCWVISAAALVRLILWLWSEGGVAPLFTYNAFFVPAFGMAGLLLQVMSALFHQAAQLKEDQDLTI